MFFLNEDYNNYKYLVSVSDNYICLSNESSINGDWNNADSVSVIYQYFNPSTQVVKSTLTSYSTQSFTNVQNQISNDFYYRADASNLIFTGALFIFFALFVISLVTSLFFKGGILFDK